MTSKTIQDMQIADTILGNNGHSLLYPNCLTGVIVCGKSLDNPTHGIPLVTWKKTQA